MGPQQETSRPADPDGQTLPLVRPPDGAFAIDTLMAGRWRIVRFIAHGAMGEVYEAEDLELGERVALKTIGTHAVSRDRALERFKREIRLARKVTHPNVCRMFDLGLHRSVGYGSEADALVF